MMMDGGWWMMDDGWLMIRILMEILMRILMEILMQIMMGILMGILMMDSMGWPYYSSDCLFSEYCHILSFVTIWFLYQFEFCQRLSLVTIGVLLQFEFHNNLSFVTNYVLSPNGLKKLLFCHRSVKLRTFILLNAVYVLEHLKYLGKGRQNNSWKCDNPPSLPSEKKLMLQKTYVLQAIIWLYTELLSKSNQLQNHLLLTTFTVFFTTFRVLFTTFMVLFTTLTILYTAFTVYFLYYLRS